MKLRKLLRRLFDLAAIPYALVGITYLALWLAVGDTNWFTGLTANIMPAPLIPALFFAVLALIFRRWVVALFQAPLIVAFALLYGTFFLPSAPVVDAQDETPPDAQTYRFSVLSFNIFAKQTEIDSTFEVFASSGADVIFLQELNQPMATRIANELREEYPYQFLRPRGLSVVGMGIISRIPLNEGGYWRDDRGRWGKQRAWLYLGDTQISLYNMHAMAPFHEDGRGYNLERRELDIAAMLDWIERTEYPAIAVGDFNMTDQTEHYARITSVMRDAHREAGWGFAPTFPNLSRSTYDVDFPFRLLPPMIRIDYIFHEPQFRTIESRVLPNTGASDHYPVYAVLEIVLP